MRIAHYVSLAGFGGVEQHFSAFARRASERPGIQQTAVVCSKTIHPHHDHALACLDATAFEKRWHGHSIPRRPRVLRLAWARHCVRRQSADLALLWNRLDQQARVIDVLGADRALYWEHGSAWLYGGDHNKKCAVDRMPAIIANSHAARRMLELRWGYRGPIRVIHNGVRSPLARFPRSLTRTRPLRLGVAGRLIPIKGMMLAIRALAELRRAGQSLTLRIAGEGPERGMLESLASELGLADHVEFLGVVADMRDFFNGIDVFVHAALREPFGLVAAEAQAAGVPVVCSAVDGLPEVVAHGESGYCVAPTLSLDRHADLGGMNDGLPPQVYEPSTDTVAAPRACAPALLAEAIVAVISDDRAYAEMSQRGIDRVAYQFDFDRHVNQVLAACREYAAHGTLHA